MGSGLPACAISLTTGWLCTTALLGARLFKLTCCRAPRLRDVRRGAPSPSRAVRGVGVPRCRYRLVQIDALPRLASSPPLQRPLQRVVGGLLGFFTASSSCRPRLWHTSLIMVKSPPSHLQSSSAAWRRTRAAATMISTMPRTPATGVFRWPQPGNSPVP